MIMYTCTYIVYILLSKYVKNVSFYSADILYRKNLLTIHVLELFPDIDVF